MHATLFASVSLDNRFLVHNVQFVGVGGDGERRAGDHTDDAEDCARGFPAFGAAAGVVVGDV